MAGELITPIGITGWTVYNMVFDFAGKVWSTVTSAFVTYAAADIADYDTPSTEQGASGIYIGDFPSGIVAGLHGKTYRVISCRRAGGAPAESDSKIASGEIAWKIDEKGVRLADSVTHGGSTAILSLRQITVLASGGDNAVILTGEGGGKGLRVSGGATGIGAIFTGGADKVGIDVSGSGTAVDIDVDILNTLRTFYSGVTLSTVNDASATDTAFVTALTEATDEHYKDSICLFTDGVLKGQARKISAYNGTTKQITVSAAYTSAPGNGDAFAIVGLIP